MMVVMMVMAPGRNDDRSFPAITVVVMVMMVTVLGYLEGRPSLVIGFIDGVQRGSGIRYRV